MDFDARRVRRNGRALHLGRTEFPLLEFLLKHPGQLFSREQLREALWELATPVAPRTVDVIIWRLRKVIE